jgi:tetratricopeptide (TPR) repeat protein
MAQLQPPRGAAVHTPREELREDQLVTAATRARGFFEEHRRPLTIAAVALLALIAAVAAWSWWQARQDRAAAEALGLILTEYEAGSYEAALEGAEDRPGLLEIADRYGSTDTGNLATFFAADALYQLGRYDEAADYFGRYDAGEDLLGASALAARAALAEQRGEWAEAGALYLRAADAYPSVATSPDHLASAARAFEYGAELERAQEALRRLTENEEWAETPAAQQAAVTLARLDAMAAAGVALERRPPPADTPPPAPPAAAGALPPGLFPGVPGAVPGPVQVTPAPAPADAPAEAPADAPAETPPPAETPAGATE